MRLAGWVVLAMLWPDWCIGAAIGILTYQRLKGRQIHAFPN